MCRKFYFDEETGQPKKTRDGKGFELRKGKVPCESSVGCAKGHYNDKPDLNVAQEAVIELYAASAVCGGAMLNDAERSDWWLLEAFSRLRSIDQLIRNQQLQEIGLSTSWLKMQNGA